MYYKVFLKYFQNRLCFKQQSDISSNVPDRESTPLSLLFKYTIVVLIRVIYPLKKYQKRPQEEIGADKKKIVFRSSHLIFGTDGHL